MLSSKRSLRLVPLLALLLLLTVFTPRSSASRLLRQPVAAVTGHAVRTIALPAAAMSREEQQRVLPVPADKRVGALLGMKPRGRPAPSGPSKRTNDINS